MKLTTGRFALIRKKFANADGHLVIEAHYWDSEADYESRPGSPRAAHDHMFVSRGPSGELSAIRPDDPHVGAAILSVLNGTVDSALAVRTHAVGEDRFGWLAHPHVQAIEVSEIN
jgi:hypothetical protein